MEIVAIGCLQRKGITNGDSNLPIHDLLTPVTIILSGLKLNKMLNTKTKFDTFQILGKDEFSKQTQAAGKHVTMRKYYQSPCPLIKFMLFILIRKVEGGCWKY